MKKRILIFYISQHSGHFHAASAIEKGLIELFGNNVEIEKINALAYVSPILEKIINKTYMEIIKKRPEIWERIYDNPEVVEKTQKTRDAFYRLKKKKIKRLLEKYSPDAVFCTQAFPCSMVANYKRDTGSRIQLVGVLTDYAPHSYWIADEVDYFVVPSEETAGIFIKKGVPAEKMKIYGIPVDSKFCTRNDARAMRRKLALDEKSPVILIMGGTQGLGAIEEVVKSLLGDTKHNYQLVVVAGSNKKLYLRLRKLKQKETGKNIDIFSSVKNVDELMEASDLIVTKAGGMTTTEALVKNLPMIIVNPIPGHERMNTDYLVKKGAAFEVKDFSAIHDKINELFDSENALPEMKKSCAELAMPESAMDIARLVSRK